MKNLLGVMQGRLVPKYKGRYQAHPVNYWQSEFQLAANIGSQAVWKHKLISSLERANKM